MEKTINFIKNQVSIKILDKNEKYKNYEIIDCDVNIPKNTDGFMSIIFFVKLELKSKINQSKDTLNVVVKIIKEELETGSVVDQFRNEILVYSKIIPYFESLLQASHANFKITDLTPKVHYAEYAKFPELSQTHQSVLVLENMCLSKFRQGPRLHLDEKHLLLMAQAIGRFHSLTFAMRIKNDPKLNDFKSEIIPATFLKENGEVQDNNYFYVVAFRRIYEYLEKNPHHFESNEKFRKDIEFLKSRYLEKPFELMEKIRAQDNDDYSVILHGDYLRNNVMFSYEKDEGFDNPTGIKIYDFQEMRYSTIALDVSFFMFFNMNEEMYKTKWDTIFKCYHDTLMESLIEILKIDRKDSRLEKYSYVKMLDHFNKHALYGALVTMMFTPWMSGTEEECQQLSELFSSDMYGKKYIEVATTSGGIETSEYIIATAKHASRMGYFDNWYF